jgi:hypothetical protein
MKMPYSSNPTESPGRRRENGMAVIVVISLLAIILIYLAGNMRCLNLLKRDLTLIDRQQTRRLAAAPTKAGTNAVPASAMPPEVSQPAGQIR